MVGKVGFCCSQVVLQMWRMLMRSGMSHFKCVGGFNYILTPLMRLKSPLPDNERRLKGSHVVLVWQPTYCVTYSNTKIVLPATEKDWPRAVKQGREKYSLNEAIRVILQYNFMALFLCFCNQNIIPLPFALNSVSWVEINPLYRGSTPSQPHRYY